ncbi:hypothetical protein FJZ31_31300 [Candidatus Poribacteria bacterium]|nr:hypothetical protein [Candidatus Poribacteria bacterium]
MTLRRLKSFSFGLALCCLCLFIAEITANSEPVQWPVNGHWYDAIGGSLTWIQAFQDARSRSYQDLPGHLATLTSQGENDFVWQTFLQPDGYWLGGFQIRLAKKIDKGWMWITRERWSFTNWSDYEPNDCCETQGVEDGEENSLHFLHGEGEWNDIPTDSEQPGYIIEYEQRLEQSLAPIKLKDIHQLTTTWAKIKQAQ